MMKAYFSPSQGVFYAIEMVTDGSYGDLLPGDLIEATDEETEKYWLVTPPNGKRLGTTDGRPAWGDIPPPTLAEIIDEAEREKQRRIDAANEFMNRKQWPGKAAIGRLKGDELAQYNLWLDYLDALEAVDTSSAPDIKWPDAPE